MRRKGSWLVWWLGGGVVAAGLWLAGCAAWLAARDADDFAVRRGESLQRLGAEQARLQAALAEARGRCAKLAADLAVEQGRARDAERAVQALRAGDRWWRTAWDKLFGDAQEVASKEERVARLEAARDVARAREPEVRAALTRATWERDGAEIALSRAEVRLAALERNTPARHYLALAWRKARGYLSVAWLLWVMGAWVLLRGKNPPEKAQRPS